MELIIVKPDSNDFCEAVGISPERQKELSLLLDAMVRRETIQPTHYVKVHDIFAEIISFCNNHAEYTYCSLLHFAWHARHGRILASGPTGPQTFRLGLVKLFEILKQDIESSELVNKFLELTTDDEMKEWAREAVLRLLALKQHRLAKDIINKLTGFAF